MLRLAALALLSAAAACSPGGVEEVEIGRAFYRVPSSHVVSVARQEHVFVRINPPDRQFSLVYDSRLEGRTDPAGLPVLFSISDGEQPDLRYHRWPGGIVVCRSAVRPRGGCAFPLSHAGVRWSVLIPPGEKESAPRFAAEARSALGGYRVR